MTQSHFFVPIVKKQMLRSSRVPNYRICVALQRFKIPCPVTYGIISNIKPNSVVSRAAQYYRSLMLKWTLGWAPEYCYNPPKITPYSDLEEPKNWFSHTKIEGVQKGR
jgi:hypothetical protein